LRNLEIADVEPVPVAAKAAGVTGEAKDS
jgi:hypothetical protein